MRLSVKIDTKEKKRRKSIRTKNLFAHHGSFSRLCLQYNLNINIQTDKQTNKRINTQYMTNSTLVSPVKMEYG